jgi:hypothetical protein
MLRSTSPVRISLLFVLVAGCRGETPSAEARDQALSLARFENLPNPAAPGSAEPNLAIGTDGKVYLSWLEAAPDSSHSLRFAELAGGRWSQAQTITKGKSFFVNWADFPSLHVLPRNRLAAHWLERSGGGRYSYEVRVSLSPDGGRTWSHAIAPHRDASASEHGFVSLWNAGDTLAAAWLDGRKFARIPVQEDAYSKEMMLLSTTVAPNGARGEERRIDERTCDCCQTSVAMTARGPLVAYRDRTTDEIRDIYVSRFERSYWTPPRRVHADQWKVDYCPVNGPAVVARGETAAVVWFTAARDTAKVLLAVSRDAGDSFATPMRIDGGMPAGRVGATMTSDGGIVVSWIERTGGERAEVRARRLRSDGTLEPAISVAMSSAARASGFPRIVSHADTLYLAWTDPAKPSLVRVARAVLRAPTK